VKSTSSCGVKPEKFCRTGGSSIKPSPPVRIFFLLTRPLPESGERGGSGAGKRNTKSAEEANLKKIGRKLKAISLLRNAQAGRQGGLENGCLKLK